MVVRMALNKKECSFGQEVLAIFPGITVIQLSWRPSLAGSLWLVMGSMHFGLQEFRKPPMSRRGPGNGYVSWADGKEGTCIQHDSDQRAWHRVGPKGTRLKAWGGG